VAFRITDRRRVVSSLNELQDAFSLLPAHIESLRVDIVEDELVLHAQHRQFVFVAVGVFTHYLLHDVVTSL